MEAERLPLCRHKPGTQELMIHIPVGLTSKAGEDGCPDSDSQTERGGWEGERRPTELCNLKTSTTRQSLALKHGKGERL